MSVTARSRRSRSTVLTAATLGVLLATGAVVSAPAAFAAEVPPAATAPATTAPSAPAAPVAKAAPAAPAAKAADEAGKAADEAGKPQLTVNPPASIGHGGQAVEFTETITNPGTAEASFALKLDASAPGARGTGRISIEYRAADGSWKPVALAFASPHFTGEITGVTVAAGATKTVQLRIAAPLYNDWGNWDSPVTLSSAVLDPAAKTVLAESTKEFTAKALTVQTKNAPTGMVAGGAPAEFDITFTNASASRYTDVDKVVEADGRSTLQVQKADGSWENITGEPSRQPGSKQVTYHLTEDKTLAPGGSDTRHVRLAFAADAPLGKAYINPLAVQHIPGYMDAARGPQYVEINLTAAPVAGKPELTVKEPSSIGYGGAPVEFTETVNNPTGTAVPFTLKLKASNVHARVRDAFSIEYRDTDGTWKPVELTYSQSAWAFDFSGKITGLDVAANTTKTVQLRLAAVGNNDAGGYNQPVKLYSAVVDPAESTVFAETTKDVTVKSLAVQLKNAPTTAVAGGAPAEFDITVNNPSASSFAKVATLLYADAHSTLQVQKADGTWENVTATPSRQSGGPVSYRVGNDDLAANAGTTKHVRLAFTAEAKLGKTFINPVAAINEGTTHATTAGPQGSQIELTSAPEATGTTGTTGNGTTGTVRNAGFTTSTTGGTTSAAVGGELAHTGSDGMEKAAMGAGALLLAGIGALFASRRRRSA
ncbi:LPXTG cell wall anchor domain-containing protein [Kitasatospora sp. CM 4170]|uniref:LPXTG cell wall anchor domain-containing protein n=1 Tax=Kitasatospora aburaviensis TaxID=67265 RepID=A0ABW1EU18_9ACTN|nr:LPXTG cell wall anchor domain-containing protein [Kitasatospora sp. CM 4170]WNM46356.1 LPXTG cell wall anchor domain-containing protein [Kitasatospora sp. CM 4170]